MPSDPPTLEWISATLPKPGSRADENEDAIAVDVAKLRFAVADGASEAWQSGKWAARLANGFIRHPPIPADFSRWLSAARKWSPTPTTASWYAEAKSEQGSFATLVGLELRRPSDGVGMAWRAFAVGDSCLFVIRDARIETAFPIGNVDAFGHRPALIPSSPAAACPWPEWMAGRACPGDLLLLASDAVACHLLGLPDSQSWGPFLTVVTESLATGRSDPLLELLIERQSALNDDATLIAIRIPAKPEPAT